jgi:hypothetical protein
MNVISTILFSPQARLESHAENKLSHKMPCEQSKPRVRDAGTSTPTCALFSRPSFYDAYSPPFPFFGWTKSAKTNGGEKKKITTGPKDGGDGRKNNSSVHYVLAEYPTAGAAMFVSSVRNSRPPARPCASIVHFPIPKAGGERKLSSFPFCALNRRTVGKGEIK